MGNRFKPCPGCNKVLTEAAIICAACSNRGREAAIVNEVDENTSDGYHTFKELYEYRMLYNALLFNEWYQQGKYEVHKSIRHHDGQYCFGSNGNWFVAVAQTPAGQITNHYEIKDWDKFRIAAVNKAAEWDGHTPEDAAKRLRELAKGVA